MPDKLSLEQVVDVLNRYHVRATYGAVAACLGHTPMFLMTGIERAPRYSWVVNQDNYKPTGYTPEQTHPELEKNKLVLRNESELRDWLQRKATQEARR